MNDVPGPGDPAGVFARESEFLDVWVQVGLAGGKVISVTFPDTPEAEYETDHPLLDRIDRYLNGVEAVSFDDVEVALTAGGDERAVLERLRAVPYAEAISTGQLARMTPGLPDDDDGMALVRRALTGNPAPLLIPDHRVQDGPSGGPPRIVQRLRSIEGL